MARHHLLGRIHAALHSGSYLTPTSTVPVEQAVALNEVGDLMARADFDPDAVRRRIHQLHASGRIDRVVKLSALGVLAAHPLVRDYAEASRLAGQQEIVALETGGPNQLAYLASADRHRGVLAFLMGRYDVALDWFTRALERERTAENLCNVLTSLLRLGDLDDAVQLLQRIRACFPTELCERVNTIIAADDDLVRLREV